VDLMNHNNQKITSFSVHSGIVSGVKFSPNGRFLGSISYDGTLNLWDLSNLLSNKSTSVKSSKITSNTKLLSLAFSPNSDYILFSDNKGIHAQSIQIYTLYQKIQQKYKGNRIDDATWTRLKRGEIEKPLAL